MLSNLEGEKKGFYINVEGIQKCGKSTQAVLLCKALKQEYGSERVLGTREPGGTQIAEEIRNLVQSKSFSENMDPVCEAYLYAAARAQSLRTVVAPNLALGKIVVADRSFITSVVIQGMERGLGVDRGNEDKSGGSGDDSAGFADFFGCASRGDNEKTD